MFGLGFLCFTDSAQCSVAVATNVFFDGPQRRIQDAWQCRLRAVRDIRHKWRKADFRCIAEVSHSVFQSGLSEIENLTARPIVISKSDESGRLPLVILTRPLPPVMASNKRIRRDSSTVSLVSRCLSIPIKTLSIYGRTKCNFEINMSTEATTACITCEWPRKPLSDKLRSDVSSW